MAERYCAARLSTSKSQQKLHCHHFFGLCRRAQLAGDQRIHFLFSGWGAGWTKLLDAQKCMQLPNVTLVERVPQEELSDMLAAADAWILPYRRGMLGISVPSRTYNILALGRPIIVLSEPMAKQEVDRYTFDSPGQATAYYYGYTKLDALRTKVEILLKDKFKEQSFHDFIVGQGLLPFDLLEKAVMDEFVPSVQDN